MQKKEVRGRQSDIDGMSLPAGKTCGDCAYINVCAMLFSCNPESEVCDWAPSRFREATNVVRVEEQNQEEGQAGA